MRLKVEEVRGTRLWHYTKIKVTNRISSTTRTSSLVFRFQKPKPTKNECHLPLVNN